MKTPLTAATLEDSHVERLAEDGHLSGIAIDIALGLRAPPTGYTLVTHLAGDEDDQAQHAGLLNWLMEIEDLPELQRGAARGAAWGAALRKAIARALEWLGDYADGWVEP